MHITWLTATGQPLSGSLPPPPFLIESDWLLSLLLSPSSAIHLSNHPPPGTLSICDRTQLHSSSRRPELLILPSSSCTTGHDGYTTADHHWSATILRACRQKTETHAECEWHGKTVIPTDNRGEVEQEEGGRGLPRWRPVRFSSTQFDDSIEAVTLNRMDMMQGEWILISVDCYGGRNNWTLNSSRHSLHWRFTFNRSSAREATESCMSVSVGRKRNWPTTEPRAHNWQADFPAE